VRTGLPLGARRSASAGELAPEVTTRQSALVVEPLPRWANVFVAAVVVAVGALGLRMALDDGLGKPVAAKWRVPGTVLGPDDTRVPVDVRETECASGRSADGRVVVDVTYQATEVVTDISIRPFGGDRECPGDPITSFVVELDEPLGGRSIVGERWPAPSQRAMDGARLALFSAFVVGSTLVALAASGLRDSWTWTEVGWGRDRRP
jgi:hypothetical protein